MTKNLPSVAEDVNLDLRGWTNSTQDKSSQIHTMPNLCLQSNLWKLKTKITRAVRNSLPIQMTADCSSETVVVRKKYTAISRAERVIFRILELAKIPFKNEEKWRHNQDERKLRTY